MIEQQVRAHGLKGQIKRLERRAAALAAVSSRLAWARLGVFTGGAAISVALGIAWGVLPGVTAAILALAAYNVLARAHRRVKDGLARGETWRAIKAAHVARIELDWDHLPPPAAPHPRPGHPLEGDLDLAGDHGLHRLLDTSLSRDGSLRLLDWLANPVPDLSRIQVRQALVRELAGTPIFRDKLRLAALLESGGKGWHWTGSRLLAWLAQQAPAGSLRRPLVILTGLAILDAALFAVCQIAGLPPYWGLPLIVYLGLHLWTVRRLGDPFEKALALRDPLADLRAVFTRLEAYSYAGRPHLRALCAPFLAERRPSRVLRRVNTVLAAASVRGNPLLWMLLNTIVPWDVYVAALLERSRAAVAESLPRWLEVWFELEALNSLANYAYLNPGAAFPDWCAPGEDGPVYEACALGHPLIPLGERVSNDFTLHALGELALITGSNMSGKSTFLRTLGVNLCLAYAGGPVCAGRLRTLPFRLATCIRVSDSVTDGISYFYAEVKCLKALLDALEQDHPAPLFFLIDEIFRGTNNRERLIGSRAYVRALVGRRGAGAISTHDLELVRLADDMPALRNYHFEETISGGRMLFDYRLRRGPSPSTNALKIMRLEGLPVELDEG